MVTYLKNFFLKYILQVFDINIDFYVAFKVELFQSKYVFSKIGKLRRGSQVNHPTALNTYKDWDDFNLSAMTFLFHFFVIKKMKIKLLIRQSKSKWIERVL